MTDEITDEEIYEAWETIPIAFNYDILEHSIATAYLGAVYVKIASWPSHALTDGINGIKWQGFPGRCHSMDKWEYWRTIVRRIECR